MRDFLATYTQFQSDLWWAFFETLILVFSASLISVILGGPIGVLVATNRKDGYYKKGVIYHIFNTIINVIRSVPFMLLMIIIIPLAHLLFGTGFGLPASILSLSIVGTSVMARFTEATIKQVSPKYFELGQTLYLNPWQTIIKIVIPQAIPALILVVTNLFITILAYSMVVGVVNGGGLGTLAMIHLMGSWNLNLIGWIIIMSALLTFIIQITGNLLSRRLNRL